MKKTLILMFSLIYFSASAQTKLFYKLKTENSNYELYITDYGENIIIENQKEEPTRIFLNDKKVINELIKKWKGKKVNYNLKCGFDYSIYVTENNKIVESISYNSKCNYAETSDESFEVKNNPFEKLEHKNTFSTYILNTKNVNEARLLLNKALSIKNIYIPYIENYNWKSYEIKFYAKIIKEKNEKSLNNIEFYEKKIRKKYPLDEFEIEVIGNYGNSYLISVYSHLDFWEKFNLYKKEKNEPIEENFNVEIFGVKEAMKKINSNRE